MTKDLDQDQLERVTKTNRENFRIDVNLRHAEELPEVISHLVALAIADAKPSSRPKLLDNLQYLVFSPLLLFIAMELFADGLKLPEELSKLTFKYISLDSKPFIRSKLVDYRGLGKTNSVEKTFQVLVSELKSDKNFGYPRSSSHYQIDWVAAKRLIPSLVQEYDVKLEALGQLNGRFEAVLKDVQKFISQLAE